MIQINSIMIWPLLLVLVSGWCGKSKTYATDITRGPWKGRGRNHSTQAGKKAANNISSACVSQQTFRYLSDSIHALSFCRGILVISDKVSYKRCKKRKEEKENLSQIWLCTSRQTSRRDCLKITCSSHPKDQSTDPQFQCPTALPMSLALLYILDDLLTSVAFITQS